MSLIAYYTCHVRLDCQLQGVSETAAIVVVLLFVGTVGWMGTLVWFAPSFLALL